MIGGEVGCAVRVEALHGEAVAAVLDRGHELFGGELQRDLDVLTRATVADGVGAGLLDAEHEVVDELELGAVLAQVVAQPLAGAQQMRGLGGDAEEQARWQVVCSHARQRQVAPRTNVSDSGCARRFYGGAAARSAVTGDHRRGVKAAAAGSAG